MKITEKRTHAARWLAGNGIEIGALHNPLPLPPTASVRYVDRLTVEELRRHYPELGDEPLVPPDIIGDAENLNVLADGSQDFVIANHLVEHLENPLLGLQEMCRVLRPGGILYVALPDPRVTFDRKRELTTVEHVVSEYVDGTTATREGHYVDYVKHAEPLVEWLGEAGSSTTDERVRELMARSHSIHFHVWRPDTFLEVVVAARRQCGVDLELLEFAACRLGEDDEYIFVFAKGIGASPPTSPDRPAPASPADGVPPGESTETGADEGAPATADAAQLAELRRVRAELARTRGLLAGGRRADETTVRALGEARRALAAIHGSRTFRAAAATSGLARRMLPAGSQRRRAAGYLLGRRGEPAAAGGPPLRRPASRLEGPPPFELEEQRIAAHGTPRGQRLLVLIRGGRKGSVDKTVTSLHAQTWHHWHAVVMHPVGPEGPRTVLSDEGRVTHHYQSLDAGGINAVLGEVPPSDMVIFLEAGDTLAVNCLFEIAACTRRDPLVDLVTWDDEVATGRGAHARLRLRPSWSPDLLLSANYLDHCFAIRASRACGAGGLRAEAGTAQLWDLLLRCDFAADRVARVPRCLAHSTRTPHMTPDDSVAAVDRALRDRDWRAAARWDGDAVRVRWSLPVWPRVSIVVPTRHNRTLVGPLLDGLARTDYPELEVVVVDNGPRTPENERWYAEQRLQPAVVWWDRPFNYSAVNNEGARHSAGSVLLFLNDDIEVGDDPLWLRELVGWTSVEDIGAVGMQLVDRAGRIQHGGVILGLTGFAGHLFAGQRPGSDTLLGRTSWYRDVLAVTAACVAVRRADFEAAGGFDEAFVLCGSDVALGLSLRQIGRRNLCVPSNALRHVESATRGTDIPAGDYFASWWRYQRWVRSGDPFFHPLLSLQSGAPHLRRRGEPSALEMIAPYLGRPLTVWRSGDDLEQAGALAQLCRLDPGETEAVRALHRANAAPSAPRTINWFIPGIDSPFYGGINTALRIAAKLAAEERVKNRFVVSGVGPAEFIRSGIAAAFPALADAPIWISDSEHPPSGAPEADADIATLWTTAYQVAAHAGAARKFYLVQDFEPMFYPAGSIYALAEESYRLGLYGICNTENLARIYREAYGGRAMHFTPAVDTGVFHAHGRVDRGPDAPVTLFVYARPGHWRNCWELAEAALDELKDRLGDRIRIIAAGSWAASVPGGRLPSISHLGLLDYAETGTLYRSCDMGLALTVSEHPSYLPLELMACGAGVVAFDNPAGHWLLKDSVNCLLAPRTVDGLADRLEFMAVSPILRRRLAEHALKDIAAHHSDWDAALSGIYPYLSDPEGAAPPAATPGASGGTHRLGNRGGARRGR